MDLADCRLMALGSGKVGGPGARYGLVQVRLSPRRHGVMENSCPAPLCHAARRLAETFRLLVFMASKSAEGFGLGSPRRKAESSGTAAGLRMPGKTCRGT